MRLPLPLSLIVRSKRYPSGIFMFLSRVSELPVCRQILEVRSPPPPLTSVRFRPSAATVRSRFSFGSQLAWAFLSPIVLTAVAHFFSLPHLMNFSWSNPSVFPPDEDCGLQDQWLRWATHPPNLMLSMRSSFCSRFLVPPPAWLKPQL